MEMVSSLCTNGNTGSRTIVKVKHFELSQWVILVGSGGVLL